MQDQAGQNQHPVRRSRKYDSYVPPATAINQSILPVTQQVQPEYEAPVKATHSATVNIYPQKTYIQPKPMPVHHKQPLTTDIYVPPSQVKPLDFTPTKHSKLKKKRVKKLFAGSIMHATVSVERITRQSVSALKHSFEPPDAVKHRTRRQKIITRSFYAAATLSIIFSIATGAKMLLSPKEKVVVNTVGVSDVKGATTYASSPNFIPNEEKSSVDDLRAFVTAPQYPRWIRIPSQNVWAKIKKTGLDTSGQIAMPENSNDIGWVDDSARPGDPSGATVLLGYVAGPTTKGAFWDLSTISENTQLEVEKGNGEIVRYRVTRIEKISPGKPDTSMYINSLVKNKHDLKLISIVGVFSKTAYYNSEQVVVYASPVQ